MVFSFISVLTQILFFPFLKVSLIPTVTLLISFIRIQLSSAFTEGHQRTLFDFAVTNMTQRDDSKLVHWPFGDFDVDKAKD